MQKYKAIGLMSGTSLDGLDIACCTFQRRNSKWRYTIDFAETIKYNRTWYTKLKCAHLFSGEELLKLHSDYGTFLGNKVNYFIKKNNLKNIDFVSSHDHTIFHNPKQRFTFQLGNGASLVSACGIKAIADYRTLDIALKGQGAPLVPVGDKLLFPEYDCCLNLGGFSNISFEQNNKRIAFDICPVNTALNYLAVAKGKKFDKNGQIAKSGKIDAGLLTKLNTLKYYHKKEPKSLGREWLSARFLPIIDSSSISTEDKLATVVEHIAAQVSKTILDVTKKKSKILLTGGGANNNFLVLKLRERLPGYYLITPSQSLIDYKEAMIFAFLGVLKTEGKPNTLCTVTGAIQDTSSGLVFVP